MGSRKAFKDGRITIRSEGLLDTGDLPAATDDNYPDGAKIWLVLSEDVDCHGQEMIGWNPTDYLFEYALIQFHDLDD